MILWAVVAGRDHLRSLLVPGRVEILKSRGESPYHRTIVAWLSRLRGDWDAVLAFALAWAAIAIYFGPGYYFVFLYVVGCAYVIRTALRR